MPPSRTIAYLSFGEGSHTNELVHALLSAIHAVRRSPGDYRLVAYTDNAAALAGLGVHVEPVSREKLTEWSGPFNYIYRSKMFLLKHALGKFGGALVFCDTDTYFRKHPRHLFDRIGPGSTLMHVMEGTPREYALTGLCRFLENHDLKMRDGGRWNVTPDTNIFNSGVIGLHEADVDLVDEVIDLIDQMSPHTDYFAIEQFALGICLSQRTRLGLAGDVVHHYWHPAQREPFQAHLTRVLHDPSLQSPEERFRRLSWARERILGQPETVGRWTYHLLVTAAARAGVIEPLKRTLQGLRQRAR